MAFDPKTFNVTEQRSFADLKVGEVFRSPSRTVTEAHFAAFQMLSGDNHPIHYDIEYCKARGLRGMLAHGFQVLCFLGGGRRIVSAHDWRRLDRLHRTVVKVSQRRLCRRHALSGARHHGADPAAHHRHCGDGGDHPQSGRANSYSPANTNTCCANNRIAHQHKKSEEVLPVISGKRAFLGDAETGRRRGVVRQSGHHRTAADGRASRSRTTFATCSACRKPS